MDNWRLCGTLAIAYIDSTGEIYFTDSEQKTSQKELDKLIKDGGKKFLIENSGFSIRLTGDNYLLVSHSDLGNREYLLKNAADMIDIMKIISDPEVKLQGGVFEGNNWSFVLNPNRNFLPAKEGTKVYDDAELEMIKRFTIGTSPKTSKWEPGYRYDDETSSIYYLGTVGSWVNNNNNNNNKYTYSIASQGKEVYYMILESKNFRPKPNQSLEEVFKENFFNIKFKTKRNTLVKASKPFATGTSIANITDTWENIIENWIKENETTYSEYSNLVMYKKNPGYLFEIFKYTNLNEVPLLSTKSKELIESILKHYFKYILVRYWNKKGVFPGDWFGENKSAEDNTKSLLKCVYHSFDDEGNYWKEEYFTTLFSELGIDTNKISTETIAVFEPTKMFDTWEHYLNNIPNVEENPIGNFTNIWIDESSYSSRDYYYSSDTKRLDELKEPYKSVFTDILEYCKNESKNSGDYIVRNKGTLNKPKYVEQFRITLDTICNKYEGNVPETIQEALINGKFLKLTYIRDLK